MPKGLDPAKPLFEDSSNGTKKTVTPQVHTTGIAALQNALKYYEIAVSFDFIELPPARTLSENAKHQWTLDEMRQFARAYGEISKNGRTLDNPLMRARYRGFPFIG